MVVLAVHIATSVLDSFAPIALTAAVMPFDSSYRPLWLGLGALSFDLLLALVDHQPAAPPARLRAWRAVHWLAYASWPVAVLHGLGTGSDTKAGWMLALTRRVRRGACWPRLCSGSPGPARRPPLSGRDCAHRAHAGRHSPSSPCSARSQTGWAAARRHAGELLGQSAWCLRRSRASEHGRRRERPRCPSFTATLSARVAAASRRLPGGALVDLNLHLSGGARGRLRVRLAGRPDPAAASR